MPSYRLRFELLSGATFGRGDGVAGLVDREVEHDACGMPYLRGRSLKGLLAEECANLLYALHHDKAWQTAGEALFGSPGSLLSDRGLLRVGDARLPADLRMAIAAAVAGVGPTWTPDQVLESLTAIRRQTAMNPEGAPEKGSLRSMRIVLPGSVFEAELILASDPGGPLADARNLALLGACVLAWRRAGTGRNRGRGRVKAWLFDEAGNDITQGCYEAFGREVTA